MSATLSTHEGRRARHNQETTSEAPVEAPATVSIEIAGLNVTVPVKFVPGHVLTDNQAKILDAAYQRQFINNQAANAKTRAEKLVKAATEAERAAFAPLAAEQIAALYVNYEPNVGGTPRLSVIERMRQDAAWRAWTALVTEHNKSITTGGPAVIQRAGMKPVALMRAPVKSKDMSADDHAAAVDAFNESKSAFLTRLLSMPQYAERVQTHLDAIMAERGAKKTTTAVETVSGFDLA